MISRRNFLSICVMMVTILILFQLSILIRDFVNNYDENVYLTETGRTDISVWNEQLAGSTAHAVLYIGREDDPVAGIIRQWCNYTKWQFVQCSSLEDYVPTEDGNPMLLCLTGEAVTTTTQAQMLSTMVSEGQNVLFCDMPEAARLTQIQTLQTLLGIREVAQEQVELAGIRLFSGFLLGGEVIYLMEEEEEKLNQEIHLSAPWYLCRSGTKVYMVGMLEDKETESENSLPLIWRNKHGLGRVFAVNGPYMQDETGLGILSAALYELQDYDLHPVVNAQNLSVANFPEFALENTEDMMEIYARDIRRFQMDRIWPHLIAATNKGNYKMTCFLAPRLDYSTQNDQQTGDLTFYLKQFREQDVEAGLSLDHLPGTSLEDKMAADQDFFDSSAITYPYSAAYVGSEELEAFLSIEPQGIFKSIYAITGVWSDADLLSYCNGTTVAQGVTADGFTHTYLQDLRVRAIETALGYSNILADMKRIPWPEEDDLHWELLYENLSSNINTYWNPFTAFDKMTISESDGRVRAFFAVDYRDTRYADTITVEITSGSADHWFLLRTHNEAISGITGGDYVEIEENVYLIHAQEKALRIIVE